MPMFISNRTNQAQFKNNTSMIILKYSVNKLQNVTKTDLF